MGNFFNLWPQSAQQFLIPPSTEKQFIHIRKTFYHGKIFITSFQNIIMGKRDVINLEIKKL